MSRLTVYRLEHELTGDGPFAGPHLCREALSDHIGRLAGRRNLNASRDVRGFRRGYHYSGVASLADVARWFGPFRELLLAAGYQLVAYQPLAANVRRGRSGLQLAFPKYAATPRAVIPWTVS